ncbi:MAG: FAD-binding oxidoreductase [Candidatus Binatia bacterium]
MKSQPNQLAQKLEAELGVDAVKREPDVLSSAAIDGQQPRLICSPGNAIQICAALRLCAEADAAVTPRSGGTAMAIGNLPRCVDVVIDLSRVHRLIEHDDANLTATVEAGMNLNRLQQITAERNQFLPFDPPHPLGASVGGTVAANLNGPRRSFYGNVRDLVIGMKVALANGEQIKAGGKVVKNVAGYDMCKLFVGSFGTLGMITEVTVRMAPLPETAATLVALGNLPQALELGRDLSRSTLLPSAVAITDSPLSAAHLAPHDWQIAIRCEGFEETVARHLQDIQSMARRIGLRAEILKETSQQKLWQEVNDFSLPGDRLVYRVTVPRAAAADIIKTVQGLTAKDSHSTILCDPPMGVIWIAATASAAAAAWFRDLTSLAGRHRGHAVMFNAPANLKQSIDVWGPAPPAISLMREIKRQFDPRGILNPGRFISGL